VSDAISSDKICAFIRGRRQQYKGVTQENLRNIFPKYQVEAKKGEGHNFQDAIGAIIEYYQDQYDRLKSSGKEKLGRLKDAQADREEMRTKKMAEEIIPRDAVGGLLKDWAAKTARDIAGLRLSTKDRDAVLAAMKRNLEEAADAVAEISS
jgi:hypothetical protein